LKKALAYTFLIIFLFYSTGHYLLFELNRTIHRNEMKSVIQHQPVRLSVLKIIDSKHDPDFFRIDRKEFRYKGNMYDIVREIHSGNSTVFICIHDAKDTSLFAGLEKVNRHRQLYLQWEQVILINFSATSFEMGQSASGELLFPVINDLYKSAMLPTWSPPPRIFPGPAIS